MALPLTWNRPILYTVGPRSLGAIHMEMTICAEHSNTPSVKWKEHLPEEMMSSTGQHTLPEYRAFPLDLVS